MIHLSETLKLVEVPGDAWNIRLRFKKYLTMSRPFSFRIEEFTEDKFKLIGIIDADTIDFDCEPYVDYSGKEGNIKYYKLHGTDKFTKKASESLRSLLNSKGARWVNPYTNPMPPFQDSIMDEGLHERYKEKLKQWQAAEQSLIKGKGVVLERIN